MPLLHICLLHSSVYLPHEWLTNLTNKLFNIRRFSTKAKIFKALVQDFHKLHPVAMLINGFLRTS